MVELVDTGDLKSPSRKRVRVRVPLRALSLLFVCACQPQPDDFEVMDRTAGDRNPNTADCDLLDPTHCLLPWPSNTFTAADSNTETKLRLALTPVPLLKGDSLDWMNQSNGFSRVSGLVFGFEELLEEDAVSWDPAVSLEEDAPLQVFCAEPNHADYGRRMAYRAELADVSLFEEDRTIVIGRPVEVLPPNADHVAVVLDTIGTSDTPRSVRLALGFETPDTSDEAALIGYHAPTRDFLEEQGIDLDKVVRVWDFTTRSAADPTWRMHAMMSDLDDALGEMGTEFDSVVLNSDPAVAAIIRGRLTNAPMFLDQDGHLAVDDSGRPTIASTGSIEFRMSIPYSDGDYRVVLYGHGTGGDVSDSSFDSDLAAVGIAKLNLRFDGWTGDDFVATLGSLSTFLKGSEKSTAGLMQALAGGTVLLTALDGVLGDAISADEIAGEPNPAAGKRPDTSDVAWVGGSMGGTMGAVIVSADSRLTTAVLNVPGAGWTHLVPHSHLFSAGLESILAQTYVDPLELNLIIAMSQNNWDDVDGAVWADEALATGGAFLLQESMGDPILPNLGTEILANALHAKMLEPALQTIVGLESVTGNVTSGAAITQFRVPDTGYYDVHGFAARDTLAGAAAMEQILQLLDTAWVGSPVMSHPDGCTLVTDDGTCDFSGMWE